MYYSSIIFILLFIYFFEFLSPLLPFRYLSQDDVLDQSNPFVQLVSGVVWLLRNGEIYINESIEAECNKTQETGNDANPHPAGFISLTTCMYKGFQS